MKINLTFLLYWVKSSLSFRAKQSAWHIINNNYLSVKGMGAFWFRKLGKNLTWVVTYLLITEWICEATLEKRRERTQCISAGEACTGLRKRGNFFQRLFWGHHPEGEQARKLSGEREIGESSSVFKVGSLWVGELWKESVVWGLV